jgi:cyclic pyranopterin phosphate synthase
MEPLVDSFGRRIENLRISITDRCNFRCRYCMPEEMMQWVPREQILTYEEIERLAWLFVAMGVKEIRVTGGEPTVRRDLPHLISRLSKVPGLRSLSMTTNGFRLKSLAAPLAEAGLTRINVSLDSLSPERFAYITRRDALQAVLEGLEELEKYPTIRPIKLNCVAIRGFTEQEVVEFAKLARRKPYVIRFIEFMPLDADGIWRNELVLTGKELLAMINQAMPVPLVPVPTDPSSTSRVYRFADGIGEIGFINPVSEPFCATCNRIRLTAEGQLRTCLFSVRETDLRTPLRSGASDAELERIIRAAVWQKELKHRINEGEFFQRANRTMSQIGG